MILNKIEKLEYLWAIEDIVSSVITKIQLAYDDYSFLVNNVCMKTNNINSEGSISIVLTCYGISSMLAEDNDY